MTRGVWLWLAAVTAMLCSCGDGANSLLPKSGGRPYEVLLVSSDKESRATIDSILSQDVHGLPQAECSFDVSLTDSSRLNQTARLARNIVIVTVNPRLFTSTRIKYEKNVWAKPQMIIYINTPSAESLRRDMAKSGGNLTKLLTRAEMNTAISRLTESNNIKASEKVKAMFGWNIRIPAGMKAMKQGHDFIWLSDNATSGMQSICVYSYTGNNLDANRAIAVRDSVMKANIPGERRGMYMRTYAESVRATLEKEKNGTIMICRGLWEMHGDAMGGPFVSHSVADTANNRIIVAEAFVYAPEMKKRNLIRDTEAALYTLKKPKRNK